MEKSYRGIDGTVGFVSAWNSQNSNVGQGEQEITNIRDGERIDYELRFLKPFKSTSPAYMSIHTGPESKTKVIWGMRGTMAYPMNLMLLFMNLEKMLNEDLDVGLRNLKAELENL
jgi:hypothetical protein